MNILHTMCKQTNKWKRKVNEISIQKRESWKRTAGQSCQNFIFLFMAAHNFDFRNSIQLLLSGYNWSVVMCNAYVEKEENIREK